MAEAALPTGGKDLVLVLTGSHPLGVTQGIAVGLAAALRQLQVRAVAVSVHDPRAAQFWGLRPEEVSACISLTAGAGLAQVYGKPIHELVDCPFYAWFLDAPIYELKNPATLALAIRARGDPRYRFLLSDRAYAAMLQGLLGPEVWVRFWPIGGAYANPGAPGERARRIGVFANLSTSLLGRVDPMMALRDVIARSDPFGLAPAEVDALAEAIVSPTARGNVTLLVMERVRASRTQWLSPKAIHWLGQIDSHQKRERRIQTVLRLKGLPVDIYGTGWDAVVGDVESFRIHPLNRFDELPRLMRSCALTLNFDPNWDDGFHDRVYTAIGMGCRVLTNANRAVAGLERPAGALAQYNVNNPDIAGAAADMVSQPPLDADKVGAFAARNSAFARAHQLLRLTDGLLTA